MHMLWFFFLFHRFVFIILFACCCVQIIKQTNNNNNNKPTKLNENPILRIHEQYSLSSFVIASYVHIHIFFAFFLLLWIYLRSLKSSKTLFFVALFFYFSVCSFALSLSLCVILITFRRIKEVNMKISEYVEWMWKKMAKTELLTNKNTTANDCNANKQFIIFSVRHKLNKKYCVYKLHKLIYCDPLKFCHFFFLILYSTQICVGFCWLSLFCFGIFASAFVYL